jgi:hypothetical protein
MKHEKWPESKAKFKLIDKITPGGIISKDDAIQKMADMMGGSCRKTPSEDPNQLKVPLDKNGNPVIDPSQPLFTPNETKTKDLPEPGSGLNIPAKDHIGIDAGAMEKKKLGIQESNETLLLE